MKTVGHSSYVKAWLVYTLAGTILGGGIGAVFGGDLGLILGSAGVSPSQIKTVSVLIGLAFGIPFSYLMFWVAVKAFIVTELEGKSPPAP